jgi:putative drug exporter of the RND superfamily
VAGAILIDALIIRCLLVPVIVQLLGRHAWWLPAWLDRSLPRVAVEPPGQESRSSDSRLAAETL